ncbi:Short-chain dehydrogenase [Pseudomonas amygdali pv. sesami]|nr:Short-chain dehydrogenase [Pseudomonas amygdali pv. sesami]
MQQADLPSINVIAVYSAAKAYVLGFSDALHRELERDGVIVTALCPGMSDTGFAASAKQTITPLLKRVMVQAGIRARQAGRMSVVPGFGNKAISVLTWATPRRFHQGVMEHIMGV